MSRLKAPKGGCAVRAYRQGLGDCFLLAFANDGNRQHYVLIDCGVLLGTRDADTTMRKVARDIAVATGKRLDALVLTHQHWDHISGFGQAADEFDDIEVGELWVSWAEKEDDPIAKELLERYGAALSSLRAASPLLEASNSARSRRTRDVMSFLGPLGAAESLTTDKIMKGLLKRFESKTRFCTPGEEPHRIHDLPDVSFFVLGPPRDVKFIRKSTPSKGDVYMTDPRVGAMASLMAALESAESGAEEGGWTPFSASYSADYDSSMTSARKSNLQKCKDIYAQSDWRKIDGEWLDGMGNLAIQLDSHLNNTSLALAIELEKGGRVLLFPADAQVGNWRSWHEVAWENRAEVTARDLLERTVFYKVGHHASHNATLGEKGLEMMASPDLCAVIPLDRAMAEKRRWSMPYDKLYDRLKTKTANRTYITDEDGPAFAKRSTDLYVDWEFPAAD